nr:hypothetical protein [Nitrospiraceae bacterium]
MKPAITIRKKVAGLIFLLILGVIGSMTGGCGTEGIVPDGSTLSVDPVSTTLTNVTVDTAVDFKVIARYADGSPIR